MSAQTETKARESKLNGWLGRLLGGRRRGYWRTRLSERYEGPSPLWAGLFGLIDTAFDVFMLVTSSGLVLSGLALVVVGPVFFDPEFFTYGLAAPIGRGLAAVCLETGNCDLRYLLGGLSLAVPILAVVLLVSLTAALGLIRTQADGAEVSEDELVNGLQLLDERLVHLRAEFVLAGVLPDKAEGE